MQNTVPAITIYLPCYNYGHFLEKAVESILSQDFEDFELLLANDGSTDNTHQLCLKYQAQDPRVIYINNEKNLGIHQTCNKLLAHARGHYITGIAADDFYLPRRLSAAYKLIQENPDLDIVYCKTILVDENANFLWTTSIQSFLSFDHVGRDEFREHIRDAGSYFHLSSCLISREFIAKHGWYEEWEVPKERKFTAEDWEANLRWTKAAKIGYVNQPLYAFRIHGSNFSSEQKMLADGGLLRAHMAVLDKNLNAETQGRLRGVQEGTLFHLQGQREMLLVKAPEIAEKVLPEIESEYNAIVHRLEQLGQLPIPPLSEQPLVTVVIPTFNIAGCAGNQNFPSGRFIFFILKALESLCQQTYTNWQAVIVNDGGEDIAPLLEDFKQKHQLQQKIQYFYFNVNQGQAAARNVALEFIWQGELVAFLDDDDLYLPHHLETVVNAMRGTCLPCVYTNYASILENCVGASRLLIENILVNLPPTYSKSLLAVKNYIPMSTLVLRRECILDHEIRFDPSLKILEDWEFLLKLSNWYEFTYLPTQTVEIRQREQSDRVHQLRVKTYLEAYQSICQSYDTTDAGVTNGRQVFTELFERNKNRFNEREYYRKWCIKKAAYAGQNLLASLYQMEQALHIAPHFLIIIKVNKKNAEWFQLTVNSLGEQYYKDHAIFVIKEKDCIVPESPLVQDIFECYSSGEMTFIIDQLLRRISSDWIVPLHAGIVLGSQFLINLVNNINQSPARQFYYFDEDSFYPNDLNFLNPLFKTDFNLDLFRALPQYVGECVAIKTEVVKTYQLPLFVPGWAYQQVLSLYDAFGPEALGHIEDVLFHTIRGAELKQEPAAVYQEILTQHLNTYGINVPIESCVFSHNKEQFFFDIQYVPQVFSKVTILCTAIYNVTIWMYNVLQLLENTNYSHYEFVVLPAMFESHPDALDFYVELTQRDSRYRFIESITEIDSPYVFYFDENITIPKDQSLWLTRLVGCITRPDAEIDLVKPALLEPESYLPVDMFAIDVTHSATTALLMHRQVSQRFQHIDSLIGVLIKTAHLCDPYFDLSHSQYEAVYLPAVKLLCTQDEISASRYRWMQDSISYNKNLSLHVPFEIESEFMVNWHRNLSKNYVKKVLQLTPASFSTLTTLVSKGMIQHTILDIEKRLPLLEELVRFAPDIIILTLEQDHRELHPHLRALKKRLPNLRIILVIEQFEQYATALDDVAHYSLRARLRAFDYLSKVLLINTDCLYFEPYEDVFCCENFVVPSVIIEHPENYLDILF